MKPEFSPGIRRYLRRVRRKLALPKAAKQRILSDLSTTIAGKLESGSTEQAVLQELGKPAAVAAEFNAQMAGETLRRSPWRFLPLSVAVLSGIVLLGQLAIQLLMQNLVGASLQVNGIIGGADGPTAIWVTTSASSGFDWELLIWAALLILGLVGYFLLRRGNHREA